MRDWKLDNENTNEINSSFQIALIHGVCHSKRKQTRTRKKQGEKTKVVETRKEDMTHGFLKTQKNYPVNV